MAKGLTISNFADNFCSMKNNKKEMLDQETNEPIEAKDFSVNENDNFAQPQEEVAEPADSEIARLKSELDEQKDKYVTFVCRI